MSWIWHFSFPFREMSEKKEAVGGMHEQTEHERKWKGA